MAVSWLATEVGVYFRKRHGNVEQSAQEDLGRLLTAALTLLGLIIGFSFSMAMSEYDQRINAEAGEANAIGTEYARAGLLPAGNPGQVRRLLADYLDQRILFYRADNGRLANISASSDRLEKDLWSAVQSVAATNPTPVIALAVVGLNAVLDSEGITSAAWSRRIPMAGWALLEVISAFANFLFGYITHSSRRRSARFWILPLLVSLSLLFIADMDSPRDGFIRLVPRNLLSLSSSMR